MTALFDQHARDVIEGALDRTLFVEAGAGTGKTRSLVARAVNLFASGVDIRRVAAITFTEAAAAELRERIRAELEREAATADDELRRQRCGAAVAAFDEATITTLHGFAQRLLAEFPLEAGLPPTFEVLDDIQASLAFDDRWRGFVDACFADTALERPIVVLAAVGLGMRQVERLVRLVHADWDRLGAHEIRAEPVPAADAGPVVFALDAVLARRGDCRVAGDLLLAHLDSLAVYRDRLAAAGDELEALELLWSRPGFTFSKGKRDSWVREGKAEVQALLADAERAAQAAVERVLGAAIRGLLRAALDFVRASVAERRAEGRLEFHDLLVLARDVLRGDRTVRRALHDRYQVVLIDEFQDTDPLQIEIAALVVTDDDDVAGRPASALRIPDGRLFMVGDPKQSIYRFRRADIALYHQIRDALGDRVSLTQNHRSRPGILAFANAVFRDLMLGDGVLQAEFAALDAVRSPCSATPVPVVVLGDAVPTDDLTALRRTEAQEIASLIRRAVDEQWPVGVDPEDDSAGTRPACLADIAVLLPTRQTLPFLEHALEDAGVPARLESQSLVFATAEVQELLAILAAIDDPTDEIAIVAALRSPGFGCRDDRLAEYALAGGRWDYRATPPNLPARHPVVAGLAALRELHNCRWWESVSETVERVIRERRLLELAVPLTRPRDHWRRLRFVGETARAFVDGGGNSLRAFVAWLRQQVEEEARIVEVAVPEYDDDAVRILTVHGAKGLEFPITVLAGLGVVEQLRPPNLLWGADGPEYRFARDRLESSGYAELRDHARAAEEAEITRLLYVAMTRARDHLIVSLWCPANKTSAAKRLLPHVRAAAALWRAETPLPLPRAAVDTDDSTDDSVTTDTEREHWIATRAARVAAARRAPTVAATALAHDADGEVVEVVDDERPPWRRGRAASAVGRAVHAVLQTVDLRTGDGLAATARAQALAEGVVEREGDIRALASSALQSPIVRDAVDNAWRYWREVPVGVEIDGVLVEGFIDLLVETPDGLVVVDYKTDHVSDALIDARLATYRLQGAAYALALETILGKPVARVVFLFVRHGEAVERAITDLTLACADARQRIAAVTA